MFHSTLLHTPSPYSTHIHTPSPHSTHIHTPSPHSTHIHTPSPLPRTYIHPHPFHAHTYRGAIHAYEENAVKLYFFVTAPVWITSILLIYLFGLIADSFRFASSTRGVVKKGPLTLIEPTKQSSLEGGLVAGTGPPAPPSKLEASHSLVQSAASARGSPGSGALAATTTSAAAVAFANNESVASSEADVEQLSATQVGTPYLHTLSYHLTLSIYL